VILLHFTPCRKHHWLKSQGTAVLSVKRYSPLFYLLIIVVRNVWFMITVVWTWSTL